MKHQPILAPLRKDVESAQRDFDLTNAGIGDETDPDDVRWAYERLWRAKRRFAEAVASLQDLPGQ